MIYLDTHVVLWLGAKREALFPERAKELFEVEELVISPAVYLEMEFLYEIGKIREHAETVFESLARTTSLRFCTVPFVEVARKAASLKWTRDPFDRMIVGAAVVSNSVLLSKDREIRMHYSRAVWE